AFTDRPDSALGRSAEHVFALRAGVEHEVAATKTFTATCVALALLASTTAEARGRSALSLAGLADAVSEAAETDASVERLARAIGRAPTVIVLGRGYLYPAVLAAASAGRDARALEPAGVQRLARGWGAEEPRGRLVLVLSHSAEGVGRSGKIDEDSDAPLLVDLVESIDPDGRFMSFG